MYIHYARMFFTFWCLHKGDDNMTKIKRGEIYLANLDPCIGSEQGSTRPVLIIQNNTGNKHSPTTIVACISAKLVKKAHLPTHYVIPVTTGLKSKSLVMLEQIRSIDQCRLQKYIGRVPDHVMCRINQKIAISLGLDQKYKKKRKKEGEKTV